MNTNPNPEFSLEIADNHEPRCLCVVAVDRSSSMGGKPIEALNLGLGCLRDELRRDRLTSARVEIVLISFGGDVTVDAAAVSPARFNPPTLEAQGGTPMGAAILAGLDCVDERLRAYRKHGISPYRPWFFLITDGQPTDDIAPARKRLLEAEAARKVSVFTVAVDGADESVLASLSAHRPPARLNGLKFAELFQWLSVSLRSVSVSRVNDQVALTTTNAWATA
ncbi:MAG: VWA domain-containing protein [Limisphaerales bacterium]